MAIYRFSAKVIGRSSGRSATAAAAYRAGAELRDERTGQEHDYTRRQGVLHSEIIAPDNAPEWMKDREQLWNAVEAAERRKDAQLSREVQLALPHQLTDDQRRELVRDFVKDEFAARGMVADVCIHAPDAKGDDRNHHAHVMLTMRSLTDTGFGNKERAWNDEKLLEHWRESWGQSVNQALERGGHAERVDHRSYADQGIDREPEPKQGPVATEMEREGRPSHAGDDRRAVQDRNAERDRLKAEGKLIDLEQVKADKERFDGMTPAQVQAIKLKEAQEAEEARKAAEEKRRKELEDQADKRDEQSRRRLEEAQAWRFWAEHRARANLEKSETDSLIARQRERLIQEQRRDDQERFARNSGLRGLVNRVRDWVDPVGARRREAQEQRQDYERHLERFGRDTTERKDLEREQRDRAEREKIERLRREAEERARLEAELRARRAREREEEERRRREEEERRLQLATRIRGGPGDWER
jgi:ATP-dependent exoDNAse (exonuclease V) alpha subunit